MLLTAFWLLFSIAIQSSPDQSGPLTAAYRARSDRSATITTLQLHYTETQSPTDDALEIYAEKSGTSVEEARRRQVITRDVRLAETSEGLYRYDEERVGGDGKALGHSTLAHDGREWWKLNTTYHAEGLHSTRGQVGEDIFPAYEGLSNARRLLGDSALPGRSLPFADLLESGQEIGMSESPHLKSSNLLVRKTLSQDTIWMRETGSFDTARQHSLQQYLQETSTDGIRWSDFLVWTVQDYGKTAYIGRDGEPRDDWYPRTMALEIFTDQGEKSHEDRLEIHEVILNAHIPVQYFTPKIEDGSNILDRRTGAYVVHGGGPSPRIKTILERRVQETKRELNAVARSSGLTADRYQPTPWATYASWTAFALGLLGLTLAISLWRRSA